MMIYTVYVAIHNLCNIKHPVTVANSSNYMYEIHLAILPGHAAVVL